MRVFFLTNIPSPYRVDFFNDLGKLCNLDVVFENSAPSHRNTQWLKSSYSNFNAYFLEFKGKKIKIDDKEKSLLNFIVKNNYDYIIIGGYSTKVARSLVLKLWSRKIPFILNADGGLIKYNESIIKKYIKRFFISKASWWLSTGQECNKYLVYYGANTDNIFVYPFSSIKKVDILAKQIEPKDKIMRRLELGLNERKMILSVGQFIHRKGFDILIKSINLLKEQVTLCLIGGHSTKDYQELVNQLGLESLVFIDFMTKDELAKYFMAADLFVLPTREDIWGLVINEAMTYGLPIITTDKCVAGLELIENGHNGFIVPVESSKAIANKINYLLESPTKRSEMAKNNLAKIRNYTIEKMATRTIEIFNQIKEGG